MLKIPTYMEIKTKTIISFWVKEEITDIIIGHLKNNDKEIMPINSDGRQLEWKWEINVHVDVFSF